MKDENANPTQCAMIRKHLETYFIITPLEALEMYGCFRLGARIWELKNKYGMTIDKEMIKLKNGKHVAKYSLIPQP